MPDSPNLSQNPSSPTPRKVSRRRFGQDAALAGAFSLSTLAALAASDGCGKSPGSAPAAGKDAAAQEVEAKLANIIRKFGDRLSQEQREHLRRILTYNEKMLASVRSFSLQNGDPPASVLRISFTADAQPPATPHSSAAAQPRPLDAEQEPS